MASASSARSTPLLGEFLVQRGVITPAQLEEALARQARSGGRLGEILRALGFVERAPFFAALADHHGLPLVHVDDADPSLLRLLPDEWMRRRQAVPHRIEDDALVLAMVDPSDPEVVREAERLSGQRVRPAVTSDLDHLHYLQRAFRAAHTQASIGGLHAVAPDQSANVVLTVRQFVLLSVLAFTFIFALWFDWRATLIALNAFIAGSYAVAIAFRLIVTVWGKARGVRFFVGDDEVRRLDERDCPPYTVLVPVYKDAAVMGQLVSGLSKLDYPHAQLDVKILFEEDDAETLAAARAADPPSFVQLLVVPTSLPRTKPKACNYGLLFARGEFLVIYDAEDIPEATQLKKAVIAFRKANDPALVCIQAALNFFNTDTNLLTRWFTLEYAYWFYYFLPGLDRLRGIIPLGGTSNHFVTGKLREMAAWDPFNVTEDADLGTRLAARGYRTSVLNSTTLEEANSHTWNWIRQRSRWIKGYMQTYLVHMREPIGLWRRVGAKNWLLFQLTIGGAFVMPLVNPILWATTLTYLLFRPEVIAAVFPPAVLALSAVTFVAGNFGLVFFGGVLPARLLKKKGLLTAGLLLPAYWVLMSIAAVMAAKELVQKPFYWQKTQHGLVVQRPAASGKGAPA